MRSELISKSQRKNVITAIRRFDLGKWIIYAVFGIALVVFLDGPIIALAWKERPFPGFIVEQTLVVSDVGSQDWAGTQMGIRHPQKVTRLGNMAVNSPDEYFSAVGDLAIGERIEVQTVLPGGPQQVYTDVPVQSFSSRDFFYMFWLPYAIGLVYLAIGLLILWMRGNTAPGRAFSFFCVSAALAIGLLFDLVTTQAGPAIWSLAISQTGGALISLALVFPGEWLVVKRNARLRFLPYVLATGLGIWSLLALNDLDQPWAYIQRWRLSYFYVGIGILIFLGITLYRQFTAEATVRQQARIVLWSSALAFAPIAVWMLGPLLGRFFEWNTAIFLPMLLFFPLGVGLAILRYRLWDIDVIVNRTLVYTILTALLGVTFLALVYSLQLVFQTITGQTSPTAVVISTLVAVALFNPLRKGVQTFIDRRFYRRKYDLARTLEAFSRTLRDQVDLSRLLDQLHAIIRTTIMPSDIHIWLKEVSGYSAGRAAGQERLSGQGNSPSLPVIALEDALVLRVANVLGAVEVDRLELASPGVEGIKAAGVCLIVPLVTQGELIGWIGLGPRLSGQEYSGDDRNLLANLAVQAAPVVRVAQLVDRQQAKMVEMERMDQEMQVARRIQHALLPKDLPRLKDWRLAAFYQPARAVGGDFYDFIRLDGGRLGIVIGDVTDKGVPAAMVMALTRTLLRAIAQEEDSPALVLKRVNDLLKPDMPANTFVTCLYAILEPVSGTIRFANAGHPIPLRRTRRGIAELRASGFPLGLVGEASYTEEQVSVEPGENIIFYSDGLIEAHNPQRAMLGTERVQRLIGTADKDAPALIERLLQALHEFTGESWEQEDDITLVGLSRTASLSH